MSFQRIFQAKPEPAKPLQTKSLFAPRPAPFQESAQEEAAFPPVHLGRDFSTIPFKPVHPAPALGPSSISCPFTPQMQAKPEPAKPLQTKSLFAPRSALFQESAQEEAVFPPVHLGRDFSAIPFKAVHPAPALGPSSISCPFTPQMQAKLKIGQPGDRYEQEADRVAEQVMRMPEPQVQRKAACASCADKDEEDKRIQTKPLAEQITPLAQRKPEPEAEKKDEDDDELVQAKSASGIGYAQEVHHPLIQSVLASPGQPLDAGTRSFMEPRFGQDFSGVRVHVGGQAAESARAVNARAYTVGRDVVFGEGQYVPHTDRGEKLIAHELTHVVQQSLGIAGSERELEARAEEQEHTITLIPMGNRECSTHRDQQIQLKPDRLTSITVNIATSTITLTLDNGEPISGSVIRTNLAPGSYQARWDSSTSELEISPWPTSERVINFVVSGTMPFLQHYDQLRRAISELIPFNVVSVEPDQTQPAVIPTAAPAGGNTLTPEEAMRHCEANDLSGIKVFPFRGTRAGAAPIDAWRDGDDVVVKQPVYVLGNEDFRQQTRTLPTETFIGGVRLSPNELVRVHVYEPRWYHINITGSTEGDIEREFCVTGEQMLQIAEASTNATIFNIGLTAFEAATLFVPVGRIASAAGRPLLRGGQTGLTAAMIGTANAAPAALGGVASRAAVTVVEEQVESQVVGQVIRQTVSQAVVQTAERGMVETVAPHAATAAVPRIGSGVVGKVVSTGAVETAIDVAGGSAHPVINESVQAGRLIIATGRTLSPEEMRIADRLVQEGRTVRALAESNQQHVRTADFIVDGIKTELKTVSSLTSPDLSGALSRRILDGAGQAPNIIADVQQQAGITRELAERAIRRAFGADTSHRIQQIRIIGNGFDLTVPRLPL